MNNFEKIRGIVYIVMGLMWIPHVSLGSLAVYESMVLSLGVGLSMMIVIFSQYVALMIMVNIFRVAREMLEKKN
jgi:hypothetical protein